MNFPYMYVTNSFANLDVEEVGDCCIQIFTDDGMTGYLYIDSKDGQSKVLELTYLPTDLDLLPILNKFNFNYSYFEYSFNKLCNIIRKFLVNSKITQALLIEKEQFFKTFEEWNLLELIK